MKRYLLEKQVLVLLFCLFTLKLFPQTFVEQTNIVLTGVYWGSVAWGDYDNDGDLDILLTGRTGNYPEYNPVSKIYRNNGDNSFTEQTGIVLEGVFQSSAIWGDYDNDGDLDILLTGRTGDYPDFNVVSKIYRNNGDNRFTEQTGVDLTGVAGSAVWGDYDNDGNLDILLTGSEISKIYHNNGDNSFTEQTQISLPGVSNSSAACGDYDNDGDLDILLAGDNSSYDCLSKIYRNNGDNRFTEQPNITLNRVLYGSVEWGDYDNDGDLDILSTNSGGSLIDRNNGDNSFTTQSITLTGVFWGFIAWGDYDNDGDLDILLTGYNGSPLNKTSKIYRNNGDNSFTEQTGIVLTGVQNSSLAWGDYDNDGDLDILLTGNTGTEYVSKIYRNETASPNVKPAAPSNLQSVSDSGIVTFTWDKPLDSETSQKGLSYSLYVYENGQSNYEFPPHAFKQSDAKNGKRLISKSGNIQWNPTGFSIRDMPPGKTYSWAVQAVDGGFQGGNFSAEKSFVIPFYRPVKQANCIAFSNLQTTQAKVTWANGGGIMRAVFMKAAATDLADPVDNTTYTINDITPGGWKCVYNGTGNSATLTGLNQNTDYLVHVCEYNGESGNENYLKSTTYQNPAVLNTIIEEQTDIGLTGVHYSSIAWGDYDNDGDLDILLTGVTGDYPNLGAPGDYINNNISKIYRNNGNNSFTEQTGISLPGVSNSSVAWGDYDNDGDLDILLTGITGTGGISKIYLNNGNNTFTEQTGISLPGVSNSSVAWGDYDNDGDLDILLTGETDSGDISKIYSNNGDNSFTEQTSIALTGVSNGSVAWGDYDNDGNLDILLTGNTGSGNISKIYRNTGNSSFAEQTSINLSGVSNGSANWGDYDGDGDLDILLTGAIGDYPNYNPVSKIYRNNGGGVFTEQTGITLTAVFQSAASWCDYDNDGDLDILLTGRNNSVQNISKIYLNNGNNTFTEITYISLIGLNDGSGVWSDYDNDGDLDILLTGYSASGSISKIYRNEILNPNIKPSVPSGLQSYWDDEYITFKWNQSSDNSTPTKAISYNLRIGTSAGGNEVKSGQALPNGKLLLANTNNLINDTCIRLKLPLNKYYWSVQAVDNGELAGNFAPEQLTPPDSVQAKDLQAFIKPGNSMLICWKNGNGLRRVLFGKLSSPSERAKPINGVIYHAEPYFGKGAKIGTTGWYCMYNGIADSTIIYGTGEGYSYDIQIVEYIEINGLPVYFNNIGNGNPGVFSSSLFSEQTGIELTGVRLGSAVWGDYDNDGDLDILLAGLGGLNDSYQIITKIYRNNGDNSFTEQTDIALTKVYTSPVAWCDFDNDGDLDILLTGNTGQDNVSKIYRNNGGNSFTEQTGIALTGVNYSSLAWGDYDNDGDLDILITGMTASDKISEIYHNNGDNTFTKQTNISLVGVSDRSSVTWGDYDNDGDLDILLTGNSSSGAISKIYRNNGDNTFTEQTNISLVGLSDRSSAAWGDYDNDGDLDILLTGNIGSGVIFKIYRNNGDNSFTEQTGIALSGETSISEGWIDCAVWGDYDNDGNLDILLTGKSGSGNISKIYRNNGNNSFSEQSNISLMGVTESSVTWGDYDNDGDLDLLQTGYTSSHLPVSKIYRNNTFMKAGNYAANRKPATPVKLQSTPQPGGTKLSWSPVKTDETPYKTLSYNVRVGTASGKSDVSPAQSDSVTGYRHIVAMGNAQLDTTFLIKSLLTGKYYWNVQAIDQGYKGGDWSAVDSFEVKNVQPFFSSDIVCLGLPTHFTDQSVATDGVASWKWDFRDGTASSLKNPAHTFITSGTHHVLLEITSSGGGNESLEQTVYVKPSPAASFMTETISQNRGVVTFINTSKENNLNISKWFWNFGDGYTFQGKDPPPHGYMNEGLNKVTLIVNADNGCIDTSTVDVSICNESLNKPEIYLKGPSVWYLACSNNSAKFYRWYLNNKLIPGANKYIYVANQVFGNYKVEISNKGECYISSDEIKVPTGVVGIEDLDPFVGLKIYPNPSSGIFTIEMYSQLFGEIKINILDQGGKLILNTKAEKTTEHFLHQMDLSGQAKGMYIINLKADRYLVTRKLLVE